MIRKKAFAIIYTLVFVILIVFIIATFSYVTYNDLRIAGRSCDTARAYYMAEAGIARKFMDLRSGNMSALSTTSLALATGRSGTYSVAVTSLGSGVYKLDSTGTYNGISRQVHLTVMQMSCAQEAYLSNHEDQLYFGAKQEIWFTTRDTLTGPVYTNDQLNIFGDPVFEGPVSSGSATINYYTPAPSGGNNPDFEDTLTLSAPLLQMPTVTNAIDNIKTASQQTGGIYLTGNTTVTLLANGTMTVTNGAKGWNNTNMSLPANGALFILNGDLNISGTLNGQLTVGLEGTNRNIYIVNNLKYNKRPDTNPGSTDMLGLVSQNNVYVDSSAPTNTEIDAYITALNKSFAVENYDTINKGVLTLYGGITQDTRGAVGTFNPTTGAKVSGYSKDYIYDDRLQSITPLYFPPLIDANGRTMYVKVSWSES